MSKIHLMCDLETTGVEPGCCILSIALVPFHTEAPLDSFYETISHLSSKTAGFVDDIETLNWWDKQKPGIQQEAFAGTRSIKAVMESACHFISLLGDPKDIFLWGNGKDFDNVILSHTLKKLGIKQPWHYRNNRCYRDLAASYPWVKKQDIMYAHNALHDAKAQAAHAEMIFKEVLNDMAPIIPGVNDG